MFLDFHTGITIYRFNSCNKDKTLLQQKTVYTMNGKVNAVVGITAATFPRSNIVYTAAQDTQRIRIFTNYQQLQKIGPQHLQKIIGNSNSFWQ